MKDSIRIIKLVNFSYKMFYDGTNYYFLKIKWWYMFFPSLLWIIPQKFYLIKYNSEYGMYFDRTKINIKRNGKNRWIWYVGAVGLGTIFSKILQQIKLDINLNLKIIILVVAFLIIVSIKIFLTIKNNKVIEEYEMNKNKFIKVRIIPSFHTIYMNIILIIFLVLLLYIFIIVYFKTNEIIGFLLILLLIPLLSLTGFKIMTKGLKYKILK